MSIYSRQYFRCIGKSLHHQFKNHQNKPGVIAVLIIVFDSVYSEIVTIICYLLYFMWCIPNDSSQFYTRVMGKLATAQRDKRLYFAALISQSIISMFYLALVASQLCLSLTWSETPKTHFLLYVRPLMTYIFIT